jgi:hypothetical protein
MSGPPSPKPTSSLMVSAFTRAMDSLLSPPPPASLPQPASHLFSHLQPLPACPVSIQPLVEAASARYGYPPTSKLVYFNSVHVQATKYQYRLLLSVMQDPAWYSEHGIAYLTGTRITSVNIAGKTLSTAAGDTVGYDKLIVGTGARVRGWVLG